MKSETADMPRRATKDSAGYDFYAPYDIEVIPGQWTTIDTGVCFDGTEKVHFDMGFNSDWCMFILPRSGMGMRRGFKLRNTTGVIDKDFRGHIMMSVTADEAFTIKEGERLCQGIIVPFGKFADECTPEGERTGGMGSTGL